MQVFAVVLAGIVTMALGQANGWLILDSSSDWSFPLLIIVSQSLMGLCLIAWRLGRHH